MVDTANNSSYKTTPSYKSFASLLNELKQKFPNKNFLKIVFVSISEQKLILVEENNIVKTYPVSTAEAGIGNQSGSFQTPLGIHSIAKKIGDNAPIGSIFKARENTYVIAEIIDDPLTRSAQDNITSRILWLEGLEDGFNKGNDQHGINVDSFSRYIYIHGTDEEGLIGNAASHGCIRMKNHDVIELYQILEKDNLVIIYEN